MSPTLTAALTAAGGTGTAPSIVDTGAVTGLLTFVGFLAAALVGVGLFWAARHGKIKEVAAVGVCLLIAGLVFSAATSGGLTGAGSSVWSFFTTGS